MIRRAEEVANELIETSRACRCGSTIYIYTGKGDVGWSSIDSQNSSFCISMMIGSISTVNTDVVALPVRRILRARSLPKIHVPLSVCFNGQRYAIGCESEDDSEYCPEPVGGRIVTLTEVVIHPDERVTDRSVSLRSIPNPSVSLRISSDCLHVPAMERIKSVMGDSTLAMLWYLGNALIDPITTSYVVAILGPSGTGKSTLMRLVRQCFNGVCAVVPGEVITGESNLAPQHISSFADARLAQSSDIEHEDGAGISKQALKRLTGTDPVEGSNGESVCLSITTMYTANSLPTPNAPDMWSRPEVMKRFAVLHTDSSFPANNMLMPPLTDDDEAALLEAMLYVRMMWPSAEGSFTSTICTIMLGHHKTFLANISRVTDHEVSDEYNATWECATFDALIGSMGSNIEDMVGCLQRVAPSLIRYPCTANGFRYGLVGHVLKDPTKVVLRSGTTHEERTRWTMCRSIETRPNSAGRDRMADGGSIGAMSGGRSVGGGDSASTHGYL